MKTIHLIFNAHIDPIWLWPWQAGLDEAIATCRSACDRLDNHPDLTYARGEAWVYDMIEQTDPNLFARIAGHVQSGQWEIVGGWWIQPDCNAPSGWAWDRQIEIGQRYFQSRFGVHSTVGYNVDSFGHSASLPGRLRAHGQTSYVMMRPCPQRLTLPARLFRWRGYVDGPEVTAYRIPNNTYCTRLLEMSHIAASLTDLPDGIDHTMCFIGLGDHGGGATEEQIAYLREHWNDLLDVRLIFSTPSRFFDAVAGQIDRMPLFTGELQTYSVGCYTVHREIKTTLRHAEHIVYQAETALGGTSAAMDPSLLESSWRNIAFAQFHDTLGGTSIPSAYRQITEQLGFASSAADKALQIGLRRKIVALADSKRQRIVAWNASDKPYSGYLEFEPWTEYRVWGDHWRLFDEAGVSIPFQRIAAECFGAPDICGILFNADLSPGALKVFEIDETPGQAIAAVAADAHVSGADIVSGSTILSDNGMDFGPIHLPKPRLDLIADDTNAWSSIETQAYGEESLASALWGAPQVIDRGPLMASAIQDGTIGDSRLHAEWRVYAGQTYIDLRLRVHWLEKHKVLKLVLPWDAAECRIDGISGENLVRRNAGLEFPIQDWTVLEGPSGKLGIVCPDVYALDADRTRVRLTLLRSPLMAWLMGPSKENVPRAIVDDQGLHDFRFRFYAGPSVSVEEMADVAIAIQRPLIMADVTKGMNPGLAAPRE